MNWLPAFVSWPLAIAGMVCAAGPVIIHLLNRRRFRTVDWAAMDYLLQAMQRIRKILRIRDLILLALRTLAILLAGLGLAQPFFTADRSSTFDGSEPLHAILLMDNSLSMSCQTLEGQLLTVAQKRAAEYIQQLPAGSRVTVAPLCGSAEGLALAPFQSLENAEDAVQRVDIAARSAPANVALNLARRAWELEPQLSKRVVLFTDLQATNWQTLSEWDEDKPLQVVDVGPVAADNTSVDHVAIEDNLADIETPATIVATIHHEGDKPRDDVQVTLKVDNEVASVKDVDLLPQSALTVSFQHLFNASRPEPGRPRETLLEVSLPPDRIEADDRRFHVAHVVASLPVVFIDRYGDQEDATRGRLGETRPVRALLAPDASERSLIQVRKLRPEQITRDELATARLVVVAGLREPGPWLELLEQYAHQGGQVLLAAGGEFLPSRWTEMAYRDGSGLLPAPLLPKLEGELPSEAGEDLQPFFLDFDSLRSHEYFQIAGVAEDDLRDLYGEPIFFQAVAVDQQRWQQEARVEDAAEEEVDGDEDDGEDGGEEVDPKGSKADSDAPPRWVAWTSPHADRQLDTARDDAQVLARFDRALSNNSTPTMLPFLIEKRLGQGRVIFLTTGLLPEWSTLPRTNAVLLLDRILRSMIDATLPQRNFAAQERLALPLPSGQQGLQWLLVRPGEGQVSETLEPGFIGRNQRGLTIERPLRKGAYRLEARDNDGATQRSVPLAVESPAEESRIAAASVSALSERLGSKVQFLGVEEEISLSGAQTRAHNMWWWLVLAALILLLIELLILAPRRAAISISSSAPQPTGGAG